MDEDTEKPPVKMYRIEYYELLDGEVYVDWVWLKPEEIESYTSQYDHVKARVASDLEANLYNYAYEDGYSVAMAEETMSSHNGVTFRLNDISFETGDMNTTKMFQCAVCEEHKDFETEVASANGFFVSAEKNDVLWHVCSSCTV
jgi:hypothetical protein